MPKCEINPKTNKPYSRHKYEQTYLTVATYVYSSWHGGMHPASYYGELTCKRCGFKKSFTY